MPNKLLEDFNKSKELLFEHVGFEQDGSNYPIDDGFDYYYWYVNDIAVYYSEDKSDLDIGLCNSRVIYKDNLFPQSVFRGKDMTMIIAMSEDERMLSLLFLDNEKEIK